MSKEGEGRRVKGEGEKEEGWGRREQEPRSLGCSAVVNRWQHYSR